MRNTLRQLLTLALAIASSSVAAAQPSTTAYGTAVKFVTDIRRADYEGDRDALRRFHDELGALTLPAGDAHLASRVRYWRGFALWRRAFNGLAAVKAPADLVSDLEQALREFEDASQADPAFVDARAGAISCLGNLTFLQRDDQERVRALTRRLAPLVDESLKMAPDNPRLLWVVAAQQRNTPPELGGGVQRARATYDRALRLAQQQRGAETSPLEPSWGEPELLMTLAAVSLTLAPPDIAAAEDYARRALELVPNWRALRERLLPRIELAKTKR